MLFNSIEYIFVFFPLMMGGSILVRWLWQGRDLGAKISFLLLGSFFFYSWWNPSYFPVLLGSILVNYFIHGKIIEASPGSKIAKIWLIAGLVFNLGLLGFFKYLAFSTEVLMELFGIRFGAHFDDFTSNIILPLAISFFTFQQIAFLVDSHKREVGRVKFSHYALFVSFFPQLIAGPIVHYSKTLPQFKQMGSSDYKLLVRGATLFSLGLFKKVVLADSYSPIVHEFYSNPGSFDPAYAWIGTIAYSLQLYFDFSGYCDMAIGSALFFGIRLPANFNSPYRATSLQDFWRRWHITLSSFLRDYVYIPLGGSRNGFHRTVINVILTFALGGIWHGAGWVFLFWGLGNGFFIVLELVGKKYLSIRVDKKIRRIYTLFLVNLLWIPFRSQNVADVATILKMLGESLVNISETAAALLSMNGYIAIFLAIGVTLTQLPWNTTIFFEREPSWNSRKLTLASGIAFGICLMFLSRKSDFLYFQF
uniref:Predicted membrane protein involved in d-alanine export n=1 Tax=uncultured Verrucomicrobiales bacterium HF0200_39L05 TaxID=710997 RepID=E0XUN5_9BACT|nr:predicted membrane protein involved in d-alanine export [uncultured Verrucomicrobiales bacterium HF0200_39L05]